MEDETTLDTLLDALSSKSVFAKSVSSHANTARLTRPESEKSSSSGRQPVEEDAASVRSK